MSTEKETNAPICVASMPCMLLRSVLTHNSAKTLTEFPTIDPCTTHNFT